MRKVMMMLMALAMGGCLGLSGCAVGLSNDGAVGIRTSTTFEFFHSSPDDGSEARVDVLPWVQEEIKARREMERILKAAAAVEDDG